METKTAPKTKPDAQDFLCLEKSMVAEEFLPILPRESRADRYRYGLVSKSVDPGREEGFRYTLNLYTVRVWTSFVKATNSYKEHDNGFVLIVRNSDNYVAYWGKVLRRTKNFTDNLLMLAKKCKQVVQGSEPCPDPECRQFMHIVPGRGGKGLMYACLNDALHGRAKGPTASIDSGLSEEMRAYAFAERKARDRDRKDPRRKSPRGKGFGNRKPRHRQTFPYDH